MKIGQSVVCHLERVVIRGRVCAEEQDELSRESSDVYADSPLAQAVKFLPLESVTVLDHSRRILLRTSRMRINLDHVAYWYEDELALHVESIRRRMGHQDYEGALSEAERLLSANPSEAELLYLGGLLCFYCDRDEQGRKLLQKALELVADPVFRRIIERHIEEGA